MNYNATETLKNIKFGLQFLCREAIFLTEIFYENIA